MPESGAASPTLQSLLDAAYGSWGCLATTASYIDELEAKCIELRQRNEKQVATIEELSGINGHLLTLLREHGVHLLFGPVIDGKATWRIADETYLKSAGLMDNGEAGSSPQDPQDPPPQQSCLNLYLVTPLDPNFGGYDTYDSFIAAAASIEEARAMHPSSGTLDTDEWGHEWGHGNAGRGSWVNRADETKAELIGVAEEGVAAGVVLASYNAG